MNSNCLTCDAPRKFGDGGDSYQCGKCWRGVRGPNHISGEFQLVVQERRNRQWAEAVIAWLCWVAVVAICVYIVVRHV